MLTPASVIMGRDYGDRRLQGRHAPQHLFTRDGGEYEWTGSLFVPRVINQPIFEAIPLANGMERVGLILNPATEQEAAEPFDFTSGPWTYQFGVTRSNAISCIQGETASRLTNDGSSTSGGIAAGTGTWGSSYETAPFTIEHQNYAACHFGMYNGTAGAWVYLVAFNFDEGSVTTIAGAGSAYVRLLRARGPNGGKLYRIKLVAIGTNGHARVHYLYPTGYTPAVAGNMIVHEMGWDEKHFTGNPMPGPANTPKATSELVYLNPPPPTHTVEYWHWRDNQDTSGAGAFQTIREIGLAGAAPLAILYYETVTSLVLYLHNGAAAVASFVAAVPNHSTVNEAICVHTEDGRTRLIFRRDDGVLVDSAQSVALAAGLPSSWVAGAKLGVGYRPSVAGWRGNPSFFRWAIFEGADCDTNTGTGAAHELYAEVRRAVDAIPADGRAVA